MLVLFHKQDNRRLGYKVLLTLLFVTLLPLSTSQHFAYTQLPENVFFSPSTPQLRILTELGENEQGSQYTLWGWFRFNGETPAISNIISMRNLQNFKGTQNASGPFPDPNFPVCPVSQEDLKLNPTLASQPGVADNPNCFPQQNAQENVDTQNIQSKGPDLLYINFDLSPPQGNKQLFALIVLLQNGITDKGNSDMKLEGFTDLTLVKNSWSYFAISADYAKGQVSIFFFSFNNIQQVPEFKTFPINFPEFKLTKTVELIVAGVELNPYFQSTSGFIGNISAVELGIFYTDMLDILWAGFMSEAYFDYDSALIEFYFDIYEKNKTLNSKGLLNINYEIVGDHEPIYLIDKNRTGVQFGTNSSVSLNNVDFANANGLVRTFAFYFQLSYKEALPDEFILLTRGNAQSSGYIRISLKKAGNGRAVSLTAKGDTQEITWQSVSIIQENNEFKFIVGISISPADTVRLVYWDQNEVQSFNELTKNFVFDRSALPIVMLGNNSETAFAGNVKLFHFKALNSASSLVYQQLIKNSSTEPLKSANADCELNVSFYKQAEGCFKCKSKVADKNRKCVDFCPINTKNVLIDNCISCSQDFCAEMDRTKWIIEPVDNDTFRLKPTREVMNFGDIKEDFVLKLAKDGTTIPHTQTINPTEQYIDVDLNYKDNLIEQKVLVSQKPDSTLTLYDTNRNLLSNEAAVFDVPRYCYVEDGKKNALKALAIVALAIFLLSFLVLLIMTCVKFNAFAELGALWKFLLHNWMKLQLIAFFCLLALYVPCCVKEFLNIIYQVVISWNHGLKTIINNSNVNDADYKSGIDSKEVPINFEEKGIEIFLLHNIGVSFIVHLLIFLFYLVVKIWDCFITSNSSCMYKTFNWMEFTILIIGYLLVEMHIFVFSFFNIRLGVFNHPYFVISFIVALLYIFVFVVFWLFALIRILGSAIYFVDISNFNRFFYFFVGYRDTKWARSYDLWLLASYFAIGIFIGTLIKSPLTQIILIFGVLVILLAMTVICRPWNFMLLWLIDIATQVLILIAALVFLVIGSYDQSKCYDCGGREGALCWLIVICLFLAILTMSIGLILATLMSVFAKDKLRSMGRKKLVVKESDEIINFKEADVIYSRHIDDDVRDYSYEEEGKYNNKKTLVEDYQNYQTGAHMYHNNDMSRNKDYEQNNEERVNVYTQERYEHDIRDDNTDRRVDEEDARYLRKDIVALRDSNNFKESEVNLKHKNVDQFITEEKNLRADYGSDIGYSDQQRYDTNNNYYSKFQSSNKKRSFSNDRMERSSMKMGTNLKPDEGDETYHQEMIVRAMSDSRISRDGDENTFKRNYSGLRDDMSVGYKSDITNRSHSVRYLRNLNNGDADRYNKVMLEDSGSVNNDDISYMTSVYSHNKSSSRINPRNVFEEDRNKENKLGYSSQFRSDDFYRSKRFDDPY